MERVWKSILNISTHYDRIRLLLDIESDKKKTVDQHREMLSIIKNKEIDKIEDILSSHFSYGESKWDSLINKDSELYNFIKKDNL